MQKHRLKARAAGGGYRPRPHSPAERLGEPRNRELEMRGRRDPHSDRRANQKFYVCPKTFIFFEKTSRTQRFEVKAHADGSMPAHEAASLLAIHCVMRGQTPKDFGVLVAVSSNLLNGLELRARKMIDACVTMHFDFQLTQRQHEVLRGVVQNLTNKEIAGRLQIMVRTVRFHVSALLAKFDVADRMNLAQKAGMLMSAGAPSAKLATKPLPSGDIWVNTFSGPGQPHAKR
jgi:DNA-binding CsgD family transcriptional regulator